MNVIALICARGGSKGLPGKNIKRLAGRPLIGWAIDHARQAKGVTRVIVSTDSPEIAAVARESGAEVPFMRPEELARDASPEWLVWRHSLTYLKDATGSYPDALLVVPTTAPLRTVQDLDRSVEEFVQHRPDVVVTVTKARRSPYFNMVQTQPDGCVGLVIPNHAIVRRQDAPQVFDLTTVAYVARPEFVMTQNGIFAGRVRAVEVPEDHAIDIDTPREFEMAELLFAARIRQKNLQ